MTPTPTAQKTALTRQKIRMAFLALYARKPLDQISIKELAYAAGINRGTFYLHYLDLDDLVNTIENDHLEALAGLMQKFPQLQFSARAPDALTDFFTPVLGYIASNGEDFRILLSPHSRPNFRQALQSYMHGNLLRRFQASPAGPHAPEQLAQEYILEYIVSANLGLITRWIQSDPALPAEEVTRLLSHISLRGPFQLMTKGPEINI
jgi:AcrR family transcriptional regulator